MLAIGVIGTGSIVSDQHIPAIQAAKNAKLHSILTRSGELSTALLEKLDNPFDVVVYSDETSFFQDPALDAVVIASPDFLHFQHALKALDANKHVFLEKPMALKSEEGQKLCAIAESKGLRLFVGLHLRWHSGLENIIAMLKNGKIGRVRHISIRWTFHRTNLDDWRSNPEMSSWWSLAGVGPHCFDLVNWVADSLSLSRIDDNWVSMRGILGSLNEETTCYSATYSEGVTCQIVTSVLFPSRTMVAFYGDSGEIIAYDILGRDNEGDVTVNHTKISIPTANPFKRQMEAFTRAILEGSPDSSAQNGLRVLRDLERIK